MNRQGLGVLLFLCLVTVVYGMGPQKSKRENFDRRESAASLSEDASSPGWRQAGDQLRKLVRGVRVDHDGVTGGAKFVGSTQEFLTGAQGEGQAVSPAAARAIPATDEHRGVKAFLNEHRNLFGHGADALDGARVVRDDTSAHNGMRTVVWHQLLDGIPVFEGILKAHTTSKGELVNIGSQFVSDPASAANNGSAKRTALQEKPDVTAQEAVAIAAREVSEDIQAKDIEPLDAAQGSEKAQHFKSPKLTDPNAHLTWFPLDPKTLRLCWDVVLMSKTQAEMFRLLVDAQTGEVLLRRSLTSDLSDASYRVFTSDSPLPFSPGWSTPNSGQPAAAIRSLVTTPALDTTASPNGWIDDGVNETRGNNVDSHLDINADNSPDIPRPQGSPNRVFDFALDTTQDPSTTVNQSAAVVQLFYWCNWMHDKLYALGFTEASGNFQNNNFGRGGAGNDAVLADAQDGSGTNNANFSTPPDGSAGRMQMYIFTGPSPHRDASFDAEIVLHEYAHGLSNRLVGGGVGMSALQSRGIGEGWSDFYGMTLLSQAGDDVNGNYASGAYCTYQLSGMTQNYYYGIRRYPYSTDMTKNPLTFKDIDPSRYSTHSGIPMSPIMGNNPSEVHCQGEVWCAALWEARANLINARGWTIGNQLILQIVTDGMKLAPANPTFLQARDAIIQADLVNNGGANKNQLWAAFAKRGMGASATAPASSTTTGVAEAFDLPDELSVSPATAFTASGPVGGPFAPSQTYTVTNTGAAARSWTAAKTQGWLTLSPSGGTLPAGGSATITATINSAANSLAMGAYTDTITITNLATTVTQTRSVSLRVGSLDWFTEDFSSASPNDTHNNTFTFTPNSSGNYYSASRVAATTFPTDPTGGTPVALGDDTYAQVTLSGGSKVSLYGTSYSTFYIGSNGYITFGSGDYSLSESTSAHFSRPRIAALFDDLYPATGAVTWKQLSDHVAVTWQNVPEYSTSNTNNLQIEIYFDGRIRITLLGVAATDGLIGLSKGLGVPSGFIKSDFSAYSGIQQLALSVPGSVSENGGVLTGAGSVTVTPAATANVTVTLTSADPSTVAVPASVIIPAGQSTATFNVTIINDALLNGTRSVAITANASGYTTQSKTTTINDDETATLNVSLPPSVTEGASAVSGTVTMSAPAGGNVLISLGSSDQARATIPSSVTIPAGQTSGTFSLGAVNDNKINGPEAVTVTAHVENWTDGSTLIDVLDNEDRNLTLSIPATAREGDGTKTGTVQISGMLDTDLIVTLDSSNSDRVLVPSMVTIPAKQTSGTFALTIVDNTIADGTQTSTVTARAIDFVSASAPIAVADNDADHFGFSSIANPQIRNAPFTVLITAYDSENSVISNYTGTVTLSARGDSGAVPVAPATCNGFVNGVWTGKISVDAFDSQVTITAEDANRHTGTSNAFDVANGPFDHFAWSAISSPQLMDNPFTITLTACDAGNNPSASYSGTANLSVVASIPNPAIGSGPVIWDMPMNEAYAKARTQVIYPANDLGGAAKLTGLSLYVAMIPGATMNNWTIRIKPTALSAYTSGSWDSTGWTTVCQQSLTVSKTGWVTIPFSTPFLYDGVSNLMVDFSFANSTTGAMGYCRYTPAASNRAIYGYSSTGDPLTWAGGTGATPYVSTNVPNIQFSVERTFPMTPAATGAFVSGSWTGSVSVPFAAAGVKLSASDGVGHSGTSGAFDVNAAIIPSPTTTGSSSRFLYFPLDTDPGWSRQGEWAFGVPTGHGAASHGKPDPTSGATGANVLGINLDGDYSTNVAGPFYLTAGPLDCTGRSATKLQFQRWLNTDISQYVALTIEVSNDGLNWTSVWSNTTGFSDSAWTKVQYDISSVADNKPAVYVRWSHKVAASGAYAYSGWNIDDIELLGTAPLPALSVSAPTGVTEGAGVVTGTASMPAAQPTDTVISLASTSPSKLTVPTSVCIPAGQLSATFAINVLDDSVIDGTKTVGIVASANGFNSSNAVLQITDNDMDTLSLNIPASAMENAGSVQGTLTLATAASSPIQVTLASSAPTTAQVPTTITVPLGQTAVPFAITLTDNNKIDGTRPVTITAHVASWNDGVATMNVLDNENTNLSLSLPSSIIESGSGTGTVSIAGVISSPLTVSLSSDNSARLAVPTSVTIAAGATSATFAANAPDNSLTDGTQIVNITATAEGFAGANGPTNVLDNDLHHFAFATIATQARGVPFSVSIMAKDPNNVTIPSYSGSASLAASGSAGILAMSPSAATGFISGTWTGSVTINAASSSVTLAASDLLGNSGTSNSFTVTGIPALSITPATALIVSGTVGGPFIPASQVYSLMNTGDDTLNWTASGTTSWLSLSSTAGTLAAGGSTTLTATITSNASSLSTGTYNSTLTFTNTSNGNGTTTRPVVLTIGAFAISAQPQPVTLDQGQTATFSVTAGPGTLTYQWQKDGVNLPAQTGTNLTLTNVQPKNVGYYTVVVSNGTTSITSQQAALNINGVPFGIWQGLVAYYPFNGNAADASVFGNNGTPVNVANSADRFGTANQAYRFSGSNSYVGYPDSVFGATTPGFTWSVWVKPDSSTIGSWIMCHGAVAGEACIGWTGTSYALGVDTASSRWKTAYASSGMGLRHIVCVYQKGARAELWMDGQLSSSFVPPNENLYVLSGYPNYSSIGTFRDINGANLCFPGTVDDVKIYNRALSSTEVQQLFAVEGPAYPVITTGTPSGISSTGVMLSGTVNPSGYPTNAYFEYGTNTSYGTTTPSQDIGNGNTPIAVSANLSQLAQNTTYHYRINAVTVNGTASGPDQTFTTLPDYSVLNVDPSPGLNATGHTGGPFSPSSSTYTLTNSGTGTLNWKASNTLDWLTLSSSSGTLSTGSSTTVTATINSNANALAVGNYNSNLTFTNLTSGSGNTTRPVVLTITPFAISSQPQPVTLNQGQTATFSVTAEPGALTYQWQKDGVNLPAQTGTNLTLTNVQPKNVGYYSVVVSNGTTSITSQQAALNINGVPFGIWQGLVAYYPFNGNAADASVFGNNGTPVNVATSADRFGTANQAYRFGTSSYVSYPESLFGPTTPGFTWSLWVLPDVITTSVPVINHGAVSGEAMLGWTGTSYEIGVNLANAGWKGASASSGYGLKHLVYVYEKGTRLELWINGQLSASYVPPNQNLWVLGGYPNYSSVGAYRDNTGVNSFKGVLDDVRIYNRALSSTEVQQLFTADGPASPVITAGTPSGILSTGVILSGTVNPSGYPTNVYFEYGTSTSYGTTTPSQDIGNGNTPIAVSANLSLLAQNTTYHYRINAVTVNGTASGPDQTFTTLPDNSILSVGPDTGLNATGHTGGPFTPSSTTYTLTNSGTGTLNWQASNTLGWLTLSSSSGTLSTGSSTTVTATINSNANALAMGNYNSNLTFTNLTSGSGNTTRPVALAVLAPLPVITSSATVSGTFGSAFSYQITATNLPTSYGAADLPSGLSVNTSTGLISGIPTQTGAFSSTISATNAGGTGSASLTITVRDSFNAWRQRNFTADELLDASISGDLACPSGDGISNLMKYALNRNPKASCLSALPVAAPIVTGSGNYLTMTYTQVISAIDIIYTVEVSGDMQTWHFGDGYTAPVSVTDNADGVTRSATVQDLTPMSSASQRFIRLKVTKP